MSLDSPSTARDLAERTAAMIDDLIAAFQLPETDAARATVGRLVDRHGVDGTRRLLTGIHGTPAEIAAGDRKRDVISSSPSVRGRIALGMIR